MSFRSIKCPRKISKLHLNRFEVMAMSVSMVCERDKRMRKNKPVASHCAMRCQRQGEFIKQKSQQRRAETKTNNICVLSIVNEAAAVVLVRRAPYTVGGLPLNVQLIFIQHSQFVHTMPNAIRRFVSPVVSFLVIG